MRRVVLHMAVSLDGYVEGPGRDLGWHMVDDELHEHFNEVHRPMSALLNGRVTYEMMAAFWPTADADPASTAAMVEFAALWRTIPKIVYSRTLERAEWASIRREVDPDEIRALKDEPGGDMSVGGPHLAAALIAHGLVDEVRAYVHPVVLGAGTPLFVSGARPNLRLIDTRRFGNGVVLLHYETATAVPRPADDARRTDG